MKFFSCLVATGVLVAPAWAQSNANNRPETFDANEPRAGVHWARGVAGTHGASSSPNMTWHGGPVMAGTAASGGTTVQAIFWGTSWNPNDSTNDKISGIDLWYSGVSGSNYAKTSTEYSGSNGQASSRVTYQGHVVDNSAAPSRAPRTSVILSKVCSVTGNNPVRNGYYPVYVDTKRGNAGYCAWHSWGSCGGIPIEFGFFFNLDGDPGCDPTGTLSGTNGHSQGLTALANVTGHELSETITDPNGNAWYDNSGSENADKCAWKFSGYAVTFPSNNSSWTIQGNWSNWANNNNAGYNGTGGCLDGTSVLPPNTN